MSFHFCVGHREKEGAELMELNGLIDTVDLLKSREGKNAICM